MPLTLFHALSLIWIYYRKKEKIDLLALTISSMIVDLEPLTVLLFNLNAPTHGFWHSYFAAVLLFAPLTATIYLLERKEKNMIKNVYAIFKIKWVQIQYPFKTIFYATILGGFSHIFFDMFSHKKFEFVLFPVVGSNPFWVGEQLAFLVNMVVITLSFYSLLVWYKASKE